MDLAREFAQQGHEVRFLLRRTRGELLSEAQRRFQIVDLGAPRVRNVFIPLVRHLYRDRPDVLLAPMWPLSVIAPLAARLAVREIKVLTSEHGVISRQYAPRGKIHRVFLRASAAMGYRLAHALVGVSSGVARDMARLAFLPETSVHVIHNPVRGAGDKQMPDTSIAETLWGIRAGKRVLTVGRFKPVKNQALLLRAFARLARETPATLMLVGSGELEGDLRRLASRLGVSDRVIFAGFQPDPSPFYASTDLFVLSSNAEGLGNVVVEALAHGTPVVSTNCPYGPSEILENGRWGRLVPVGDEQALAQAMHEALHDPPDPTALRRRAADFAPEIAAKRYLEVLGLT
ncbi:MAG: glycosyl transferase [Pirellulaceae bacterium]|nr:MAG: glycosyl transferase [Pirellulaceae bacterium]